MIAYITKTKAGYVLRLLAEPANGPALFTAPQIAVADKKEARAYCKANGIIPHNF